MNESPTTAERPDPEECSSARATLEFARAGESDASALAAASQHLEACLACQRAVRFREQLDARIGALCRDVPVPPDLKSRLLAALSPPEPPAAGALQGPARTAVESWTGDGRSAKRAATRRRWLQRLAVAAACASFVGLGTWYVRSLRPTVELNDLISQALHVSDSGEFAVVAEDRLPPLPATMDTGVLRGPPRAIAGTPASVHVFQLRAKGGRRIAGRLLIVPSRHLAAPPVATAFLQGPVTYLQGHCASAWVEGEFAFVCLVEGGEGDLHRLERSGPRAA